MVTTYDVYPGGLDRIQYQDIEGDTVCHMSQDNETVFDRLPKEFFIDLGINTSWQQTEEIRVLRRQSDASICNRCGLHMMRLIDGTLVTSDTLRLMADYLDELNQEWSNALDSHFDSTTEDICTKMPKPPKGC